MIEDIYIWILFVTICIITLIPPFIFIVAFFNDDDDEAGGFSYLMPLTALMMGFFPIVGSLVINVKPEQKDAVVKYLEDKNVKCEVL